MLGPVLAIADSCTSLMEHSEYKKASRSPESSRMDVQIIQNVD